MLIAYINPLVLVSTPVAFAGLLSEQEFDHSQ